MKIWKKINKGLILTIIVLAVLIIYLEQVEKQREIDKTAIKTACKEYIEVIDNLIVLPEEMQQNTQNLTDEQENKIKENIKSELEKVMIDNEDARQIQEQFVYDTVKDVNKYKILTKCNKTIDEIEKYEFDGDQVVVSFSSNTNTSYKLINLETNTIEEEKDNINQSFGEEITLQKVEGIWKVVYSYLDYYQSQADLYVY